MFTLTDSNGNSYSGQETLVIDRDCVYIDGQPTQCLPTGKIEARGNIPAAVVNSSAMIHILGDGTINLTGGIMDCSGFELIDRPETVQP